MSVDDRTQHAHELRQRGFGNAGRVETRVSPAATVARPHMTEVKPVCDDRPFTFLFQGIERHVHAIRLQLAKASALAERLFEGRARVDDGSPLRVWLQHQMFAGQYVFDIHGISDRAGGRTNAVLSHCTLWQH